MTIQTVESLMSVLTSKLVAYDRRSEKFEAKRGIPTNINRLGLLLIAAGKVEADLRTVTNVNAAELPWATHARLVETFKRSLSKHFLPDFSPVKSTLKALEKVGA